MRALCSKSHFKDFHVLKPTRLEKMHIPPHVNFWILQNTFEQHFFTITDKKWVYFFTLYRFLC